MLRYPIKQIRGFCLLALCCTSAAQAASFDAAALAAFVGPSGSVIYSGADGLGTTLTVTEFASSSLLGSKLFGYEGLWLGEDNTGGSYSLVFNRPVVSMAFSFIALTAFAGGEAELLTRLSSNRPTLMSLLSADNTATWDGNNLLPLEEDSRGVFTITDLGPLGFTTFSFVHLQAAGPLTFQGFVIDRIDYTLAVVPEPTSALLMGLGLLALHQARQPRRHQARHEAHGVKP